MPKDPYKYFRVEARELLQGMSQGVLELERGAASKERVGSLLRLAHTLKGAARVVKVLDLARHAHTFEDVLAPLREKDDGVPRAIIDTLLGLLDAMASALGGIDSTTSAASPEARDPAPARTEPLETVRIEIEEMDRLLEGVTEATVQLTALRRGSEDADRAAELASVLVDHLRPRRDGEAANVVPLRAYALAEELERSVGRVRRGMSHGIEQVSRELSQVRDAANRLRLLPASVIFGPLERAVRDAAEQLGKRVVFEALGGEGRLDAHVLTTLRDALFHVVRNAVAHGIETASERAARGKPATGRVRLRVERRGSTVAFICEDDGQGVDEGALRQEAVRVGMLSASEAPGVSAEDVFRLLLRGGLTTTRAVTEVSGRAIGLDVVRETATRLHGDVAITSEPGKGTRVEICVPVSLSSLSALIVDAAGVSAVVPLDAVSRTLRLVPSDISHGPEGDSILYEGTVIPFFPLATALRRATAPVRERRQWSAVVVRSGGTFAAVGVDRLVGTAIAVVRPLPAYLEVEPVVIGAALDGEGNPQLVLDPDGLVVSAQATKGAREPERKPTLPILVVDDSLTTRMLEQSILESAGYEVGLATSAEEAWVKAKERRYGLFVVDVEMPGMDGFEFVTRTRADPTLRETPAILVTSRNAPEDRRRGQEAGAHAYIVKGEFDQGHLLRLIREILG
jgi:two-component system chemotaxis sensor kinase CheA